MTVYVDENHRCHAENAAGRTPYDLQFFDGKSENVVECYEYYPATSGSAERIKAIAPVETIDALQKQYVSDLAKMQDMQDALAILGVSE